MAAINSLERIKKLINKSDDGFVFVASDFSNIANNEVVRKSLSLLAKRKIIHRINHGLYVRPVYSELTKDLIPLDLNEVANAISRNYGWRIVPFGQTALNILGLSTQVPVTYEYLSDGPYRKYEIDGYNLCFFHRRNKDLHNLPYKTTLIISALQALGESNITSSHIEIIKTKLTVEEKKRILEDTKYITRWIRVAIESAASENKKEEGQM